MVFCYVAKLELIRGKGTNSYSYIKNYLILQRVLEMKIRPIASSLIMSGLTGETGLLLAVESYCLSRRPVNDRQRGNSGSTFYLHAIASNVGPFR
jgi:hypothetical protein